MVGRTHTIFHSYFKYMILSILLSFVNERPGKPLAPGRSDTVHLEKLRRPRRKENFFALLLKKAGTLPIRCDGNARHFRLLQRSQSNDMSSKEISIQKGCSLCWQALDVAYLEWNTVWHIYLPVF